VAGHDETGVSAGNEEPDQQRRRLVLLGASNLRRRLNQALTLAGVGETATDVLVAAGHGRSYGTHSTLLIRTLPGITECGLWPDLQNRRETPTAAILTDIGNDLLYGASVEALLSWVECCIDRLAAAGAKLALCLPPLRNLPNLSRPRYYTFRTLFFPLCRLRYVEMRCRVAALHRELEQLATARNIACVDPPPQWYGLDPIHFTYDGSRQHWQALLEGVDWPQAPSFDSSDSGGRTQSSVNVRPQIRWIAGIEQRAQQPTTCFPSGTTVSFY